MTSSRADDHARGVGAGVARHPLQGPGDVDELMHLVVRVVGLFELRGDVQRLLQGHLGVGGDHLAQAVHLGVGQAQHAAHVPHRKARGHGAKGDDLADVVRAVLAGHIVDDLLPPLVAEVDVKVQHGDALRVEEPLKDQVVLERVDARDAQRVGAQGPRAAAAPRADGDALAARIADEIPDDEEVVHVPHPADHGELVLQALLHLALHRAVAAKRALEAQAVQVFVVRLAVWHGEVRQVVLSELELDVAAAGDRGGVVKGLRRLGEEGAHLLLAL